MNKKTHTIYPWLYFISGIGIILIDRGSKMMALTQCVSSCKSRSFISYSLAINRGISCGLFHSNNMIHFFVLSIIIAIITVLFAHHAYKAYCAGAPIFAEICIIAGSCSNLFDRFVHHGVIDFILLSYKKFSFPIFNVADIAIVCGIIMLIINNHNVQKKKSV